MCIFGNCKLHWFLWDSHWWFPHLRSFTQCSDIVLHDVGMKRQKGQNRPNQWYFCGYWMLYENITSNYRQIRCPNFKFSFVVSSIVDLSTSKIAYWIVSVWRIGQPKERSLLIIISDGSNSKFSQFYAVIWKFWQKLMLAPPPGGWLPLHGECWIRPW